MTQRPGLVGPMTSTEGEAASQTKRPSSQVHPEPPHPGLAKDMYSATPRDKFNAVVLSVRAAMIKNWINTQQQYYKADVKRVYYLSMEFLLGRLLNSYLINLGLADQYREAVGVLDISFEEVLDHEWDAALGNGGLGRLAACFLDSMATLRYPCYGYGIRYEYGIFSQRIKDGYQTEAPDNWLRYGNFWEFPRAELLYPVRFYGEVQTHGTEDGRAKAAWVETDEILAMAYDYPVPGYRNAFVNTLRLWAAKSTRDFNLEYFNSGDYVKAVEDKNNSENISKVLYPNDYSLAGKELRLKQQYFFVAATLSDVLRRYKKFHETYDAFPGKGGHPVERYPSRRSRFPSSCGFSWMKRVWSGTMHGRSRTNGRLHEPYDPAGGARNLVGRACGPSPSAPSPDHPGDRQAIPHSGDPALSQ